ncbi:MAG: diacylglycerol kinase family protein [Verrucomicrobiota bacterium JB022]|nr:diacylglycerol kinase family protein [Verrucomicrobiota bacterium JB022]
MPEKRLQIILNRRSGTLIQMDADAVSTHIQQAFEEKGWVVEAKLVEGPDLVPALDQAVEGPADTILVGGGDGTIATAVEKLRGTDKTLAILPLGTMNLLAKDLDLPDDWKEAVETLLQGEVREIDIAMVNGQPFTCMSVLGVYPRISESRESLRGQGFFLKWLRVFGAGIRILATYPLLRVKITTAEGETHELRTRLLMISNNQYEPGVIGQLPRRRALDEGKLGIYVYDNPGRWQMLYVTAALLLGWWDKVPDLRAYASSEVTIQPRRKRKIRTMTDGEILKLRAPLKYSIEARGLRMLTSPQMDAETSCPELKAEEA